MCLLPEKLPPKKLCSTVHSCLRQQSVDCLSLVLLPGWGFDRRLWRELVAPLQGYARVITLDLPGFGDNRLVSWGRQEDICRQIVEAMPARAVYAGWSLGGMLATRIAADFPDRVVGIITLATNASFIERYHWPDAMDAVDFQHFYDAVVDYPRRALKRFCQLLTKGDKLARQQLRWLRNTATQSADYPNLAAALSLLKALDNSDRIGGLQAPGLHIFGERDRLVPVSTMSALKQLSSGNRYNRQQYYCLNDVGHLVFWPNKRVISLIGHFLAELVAPSSTASIYHGDR